MYVSSGSETLHQPVNHSPVHTEPHVSYDCPKYKLTQERALPLVRWYEEHQDHPYPNRQEKLHLCQATQLTYTQVNTFVIIHHIATWHACMPTHGPCMSVVVLQ